jgi:hypothetical protein
LLVTLAPRRDLLLALGFIPLPSCCASTSRGTVRLCSGPADERAAAVYALRHGTAWLLGLSSPALASGRAEPSPPHGTRGGRRGPQNLPACLTRQGGQMRESQGALTTTTRSQVPPGSVLVRAKPLHGSVSRLEWPVAFQAPKEMPWSLPRLRLSERFIDDVGSPPHIPRVSEPRAGEADHCLELASLLRLRQQPVTTREAVFGGALWVSMPAQPEAPGRHSLGQDGRTLAVAPAIRCPRGSRTGRTWAPPRA